MIEISIFWIPLLIIPIILGAFFIYLYFKDKDVRKKMFAIALFISSLSFLSYVINFQSTDVYFQFLQKINFWSTFQLLIFFLIIVNEQYVHKKDFNVLYKIYITIITLSLFILFLIPIQFNVIPSIFFPIISFEIIGVLIYLIVRYKNLSDLIFLCAICSFAIAGASMRNLELIYLTIFSFIVGYVFLSLVFIIISPSQDKLGIGAYFTLQRKLETAEKALQESEERIKNVLENIPDHIMNVDPDGKILYMNKIPIQTNNKNINENTVYKYTPSKYYDKMRESITQVYNQGIEINFEMPEKLSDGRNGWFLIRLSPIKRYDKVISIMRIATDITEKRKIETELKNRLKDLENTEIATLNIMEDMAETVEILKIAETEIKNKNKELQTNAKKLEEINSELIKTREKLVLLNKDLEIKVKKRTKEIEQLLKQKDEFIGQLGHDLKTPLTPLYTLLPMIRQKINDPKLIEMMDVNINNVKYMKNLVSKTLQLAKLNSPVYKLDIKTTNLLLLTDKIIEKKSTLLNENNIIIYNNIDKDIFVKADMLEIEELFSNIISNAVKYTDGGGIVNIKAKKDKDGFIKISIADNGSGMTQEQINYIFDEFYKTDTARHDLDSHGLGLSICKRVVEKHGGKIWAESPGIGKGSTFYFTIKSANKKNN